MKKILQWSYVAPVLAWIFYLFAPTSSGLFVNLLATGVLIVGDKVLSFDCAHRSNKPQW